MSAKEVKRAQASLTCPVCYQLYKNPKYLPCYHSYCERCLEKMQLRSKIICPDCRMEAKVPSGGVKKFATNFFINRLVDDLILKKKVPGKEEVKCDSCDDGHFVVMFCSDCNLFLCQTCSNKHQHTKRCQGHNLLPLLTELKPSKDATVIQAKEEIPICKEHDYELKHYCETCDVLVCMYCIMKDHSGHSHDSTKAIAGKLKKATASIEEMVHDLTITRDKINKMRKEIKLQGEEVNKRIDQHYDRLINDLLMQRDRLKQQANNMVSHKDKVLKTQLDEVDSMYDELLTMKEVNAALHGSSDHEVLSAKKQVINSMQRLTEMFQKLSKNPVQSATMEYIPTYEDFSEFSKLCSTSPPDPLTAIVFDLPESIIVGKDVEATIITNDSNGDQCSKGGNQVSVELQSSSAAVHVAVAVVQDNKDGTYVASFIPEQVGPAKLSVFINGQQIKGSPYNIAVSKDYQLLELPNKTVCNSSIIGQPWGIAFGRNGLWAVTDFTKYCVHVFNEQDELVRTFGTSNSLNCPRGVAFDNDNHLHVADTGNHRVQKFNVNGYFLLQFGSYGAGAGQLNHPFGIATHNGRVYVADKDNHRISVFQCDGQFCFSFGSDHLGDPWDVAINADNQLLVADGTHHCIVRHTFDGRYVGKFGEQGSRKGHLNNPYSLCTDINGFVLVTDSNHHVNVFNHVGKFVHCFGSCGASKSQFDHPYGIAISSNGGSVYVCDTWNNRVQLFI